MKNKDKLLHGLDGLRSDKWIQTTSNMDYKHTAWGLLRKLVAANPPVPNKPSINPNLIATQIVNLSKAIQKQLRSKAPMNSSCSAPFTL